jgi:hypothetical protein
MGSKEQLFYRRRRTNNLGDIKLQMTKVVTTLNFISMMILDKPSWLLSLGLEL